MARLTPQQEKFAKLVALGTDPVDAYKQTYKRRISMQDMILKAQHTLKNERVQEYIAELKESVEKEWTRADAVQELMWAKDQAKRSITRKGIHPTTAKMFISAVNELNVISRFHMPTEKEELLIKKLEIELVEREAKATIIKNTADRLTGDGEANELLKSLLDVVASKEDNEDDTVQSEAEREHKQTD